MNNSGKIILQKYFFSDSEKIIDLNVKHKVEKNKVSDLEHLYKALMIGLKLLKKITLVLLFWDYQVELILPCIIYYCDCLDKKN